MSFEALLGILNNAAFLLALGVLYNTFSEAFFTDYSRYKVIIGVFIGLIGIAVMLNPWDFGHGVIFDTRSILLSVSALFFGFIPALISVIMTAALRIYLGGAGVFMGVGVILTSAFFGLLLRFLLTRCSRKVQDVRWYELFLLGLAVHIVMILWMFILPEKISEEVFLIITYPVISSYPIVTIFLWMLLSKQLKKARMQELIEKMDKIESLGILAGGLAHDFNNLLSGIFGYIEMALTEDLPPGAREKLKKAISIHKRAEDLTRQLLTFSKGGVPEKRLGKIERTIRDSVLFAMSGTSVLSEFDISEDLYLVEYDHNQMSEVFSNIAINAQQAMNGKGKFKVTAENITINESTKLTSGKYVKISLKDTGPGIPQNIAGKIFDPFFSTKKAGNGLGLATSFSVLKKHGGLIEVDSSPGKGAEFKVFLPASEKTYDEESLEIKVSKKGEGTILVMDDEDFIRSVVGDMIVSLGYTPVTVADGKDAVDKVRESLENKEKISMVFLDLTVPGGMGGAEAVKTVKTLAPEIPVIASSGYSDDPIISNPEDHGFDDSIKKPFLLAGLSEVISRNLKI